jgi:predicted secreted Zn-dependent protease
MGFGGVACLASVGVFCCAASASADVEILVKTRTYDISGASGQALIAAMSRNGPRHGFMTRAIAQTSYTKEWDFDLTPVKGACVLKQAHGTLHLTFTYPRVTSTLPPALDKRWRRFFDGVRSHEETHAALATEMMEATEKSLTGLRVADDPQCSRTRRQAQRQVETIYDRYEVKQNAFDAREHREGGHVEYLAEALISKKGT